MGWHKLSEKIPQAGKKLFYYFEFVGVHRGQFDGINTFYGDRGFLTGDVTHWQYDEGQDLPKPPEENSEGNGSWKWKSKVK